MKSRSPNVADENLLYKANACNQCPMLMSSNELTSITYHWTEMSIFSLKPKEIYLVVVPLQTYRMYFHANETLGCDMTFGILLWE